MQIFTDYDVRTSSMYLVVVLSLKEGNNVYCSTYERMRTSVYVPGTVAAASCMLHTAVQ